MRYDARTSIFVDFFASRDVFRLKGAARGLLLTRLYKSMRISLFHKREQLNFIEIIFSLISQTLPKDKGENDRQVVCDDNPQ